jgi:crotonobetainyl-CoA:carnitine CoA-transferase CaiB-like acyl-CoA transferase
MTDGLVSWMSAALTAGLNDGGAGSLGGPRPGYGVFRCKDGYFTLSIAGEEHFWRNLCNAVGRPDLAALSRQERARRIDEINGVLAAEFAGRTRAELDEMMMAADVAAGPVLELDEVLAHPQMASRGLVGTAQDASGRQLRYIKAPLKFSETPVEVRRSEPGLGENTDEILVELGYSRADIKTLSAQGAI